jgi:hypothetical protein
VLQGLFVYEAAPKSARAMIDCARHLRELN